MSRAQSASPVLWKYSKNVGNWPSGREFMTSHVICEQREKMWQDMCDCCSRAENVCNRYYRSLLESEMKQKELEIWSLGQKIERLEKENAKAVHNQHHLCQTIVHYEWERTFMYKKELINTLEKNELKQEIQQLKKENQKCAKAAKENEKLLRRSNDEHRLNYENQRMQDEMRNLNVKIKHLKEENDILTNVSKTCYGNEKLFITKERNQLQETISLLRNENKKLQDLVALSKDRCTATDNEVERLQMEVQHNQSEMQLLKERITEKETNNAKLKKDILIGMEERENLIKINKQLQDDLHSQDKKVGVLEQGVSTFKKEWKKLTDTEKELSQLRDRIRDMEHDMLRQKWNRPNDTEPNHLQTKVKHMEEEKSRLTEKLSRSDNVEKELLAKINGMNEEKAQQLKRSKIIEEEHDQLQAKIRNIEEERARLAQQLNKSCDAQLEINELCAKVNKMEEERAKVERQLSRSYDTERELNELRINVKNMEEEKSSLAQRLNVLNDTRKEFSQLHAKIQGMEDENSRLKRQLTNSNNLNKELNKNASEMKTLTENNEKLTAENKQLQNAISKERDEFASRILSAEEILREYMKEIGDKNDDIQQLQTEVNNLTRNSNVTENELLSVKGQIDRLREKVYQLSNENNNLQKENVDVSRQKEDALQRLSRLAGAKLTHGNAAITDLSDTDRPTKIAEKFSELYDNAWTDAFEELDTTYHNETETINVLLKILQESYTFCVQTEKDYEDRMNRAVLTLADREITSADVGVQKALVDLRISLGNPCCSVIEEVFSLRLPSILRDVDVAVCPKTKTYAHECASLCWRMRIREPPVFVGFEFRKGTTFNQDILRKFTTTGGYLDFLVWPALYLHENGPLLAKGVAQAKLTP